MNPLSTLVHRLQPHLSPLSVREVIEAAASLRVARLMVAEEVAVQTVPLLRDMGLSAGVCPLRFLTTQDEGKGGWANRIERVVEWREAEGGQFFVYVSTDEAKMVRAVETDLAGDHDAFGALLGIPSCCRRAYIDRLPLFQKGQNDSIWSTLLGTSSPGPHDFWNNVAARYFGYSLLSFAPCSLECNLAAGRAREALRLLESASSTFAARFVEEQRTNILYSERAGVHRLLGAKWAEGRLRYSGVQSTEDTSLTAMLLASDSLEPVSIGRVQFSRGSEPVHIPECDDQVGLFLCGIESPPSVR